MKQPFSCPFLFGIELLTPDCKAIFPFSSIRFLYQINHSLATPFIALALFLKSSFAFAQINFFAELSINPLLYACLLNIYILSVRFVQLHSLFSAWEEIAARFLIFLFVVEFWHDHLIACHSDAYMNKAVHILEVCISFLIIISLPSGRYQRMLLNVLLNSLVMFLFFL